MCVKRERIENGKVKIGIRGSVLPIEEKKVSFLELDTLAIALQMCIIEQELYENEISMEFYENLDEN